VKQRILSKIKRWLPIRSVSRQGISRLTLRFGKRDLPSALGIGKKRSLATFQGLIADCVQAHGAIDVHFIVDDAVDDDDVYALIRFAHRLGCKTDVLISGVGVTEAVAERLLLCGTAWVWIPFGGVSSEVHFQSVGLSIEQSTQGLQQLLVSRQEVESSTKIGMLMPWVGQTPTQMDPLREWAEELGVDSWQPHLPYFGKDMATEPVPNHQHLNSLFQFVLQDSSVQPGWKRRQPWSCPVGKRRLEVSKYGRVCACPHKKPVVWEGETLSSLQSRLRDHRQEVHQCDRVCLHRELRFV